MLEGADLDLAVARGAAYYGWARHGHGVRIRGGTARAYYVGVESRDARGARAWSRRSRRCASRRSAWRRAPQADVPPQEFGLVVGEPVRFRFFSCSVRRDDAVGAMLDDPASSERARGARADRDDAAGDSKATPASWCPVNLQAAVTEIGTLELRCLEKRRHRPAGSSS